MIDYDPHSWRSHLFDIRGSMAREIAVRVTLFTLWSAAVVLLCHYIIDSEIVKSFGPHHTVHGLVGTALGLLLVFRTNASYDRFWEGRKLWGGIVNESRNLARLAVTHLNADQGLRDRIVRWAVCFPYVSMYVLRKETKRRPDAEKVEISSGIKILGPMSTSLPPDDCRRVLETNHIPTAVARQISELLREARDRGLISDYVMAAIDQNTQQLIDYVGGCERIHKTPIPFAYMVHVRRALILYCFFLPFALAGEFDLMTVPITFIVAYVFIGIEEIGVEIEDPFGHDENDLPLEAICATIERNLLDMIHQPPVKPQMIEGPVGNSQP